MAVTAPWSGAFSRELDVLSRNLHDLALAPDRDRDPELAVADDHASLSRDDRALERNAIAENAGGVLRLSDHVTSPISAWTAFHFRSSVMSIEPSAAPSAMTTGAPMSLLS